MTSGLHHITLIARKVQANVDFYAGFLGLRLVKRTGGFEDATQLHLFYGDAVASPGSLVTFLVWEDGSPGRVGHGAPSEIAFAIRPEAIGFWLTRSLRSGVRTSGPAIEFGEPVLRFTDPDGVIVKLVGTVDNIPSNPWIQRGIPEADAIRRLRGATILSERPRETIAFLAEYMGFMELTQEKAQTRLISEGKDVIDVRDAGGFWTAAPGTGTIDHIAVRAPDRDHVEGVSRRLKDELHGQTVVHDRKYFYSLYVREPSGTLIELASDGPGFSVDEPVEKLGQELFIPPHFARDDADIRSMLPQFGLPGEPRTVYRDLPFVHRIHEPERPDGSSIILLHGTGGNEASLMPFGRRLAPNATLIGLRGRSTEEGTPRFFRRLGDVAFDQKDIVAEAEALAAFVDEAVASYGLDPARMTFVGYSNGANMLGAAMLLQPLRASKAILLRPMMVLEQALAVNLNGVKVLMVTGRDDPYAPYAGNLEGAMRAASADVTHEVVAGGHALADADSEIAGAWLSAVGIQQQ
ncbi:MAG: glyoxalase [Rhizobium sp.]|nr:glyoxalase [Rhizobium sp.]